MDKSIITMSEAQYRAADGTSKSDLDWIAAPRTPAHFFAKRNGLVEIEETAAMRFGTLVHRVILEPDTASFAVKPAGMNFTTKEGKEWRAAQTLPILTQDEADAAFAMRDAVYSHPKAKRIFSNAQTEQCLFAQDEQGSLRKGRLDALIAGSVVPDLKTSQSADPAEFERSIGKFRYHVQAAYYIDLCKLVGLDKRDFVFVVVEKQPPYAVAVYSLDQDAIALGRREYQRDLALVRECEASGKWPGFSDEITIIGLPAWMQKQAEALV